MEIVQYYKADEATRLHLLREMKKTDWDAGRWLCDLMAEGKVQQAFGEGTEVLVLTEGDKVASFCTLAPQDEIDDPAMTPWVGFVFTFPAFRGQRCAGKLIEKAVCLCREQGFKKLYVSSEEKGLYEKYGFTFLKDAQSVHGYETQIFCRDI